MPSLVKIKVERGRDLPPMDNSVATEYSTDAYVEVRLENHVQKTNTYRRSLNPVWNEEFRFDFIDDAVMQDEPLELKCFDQDLYSSELIGVTYIDLNPLIMRTTTTNDRSDKDLVISGWFPLFDTARGMRGALFVTVKLQFIGNENPFQDSSAGIQFFSSSRLSSRCFFVQEYIGFVEETMIQEDQENSWQDYFKGNKISNDNRLKTLYALSAETRRKLGKKVYENGGNAVLGYAFHLDTEGSSTIVARAYGTACRIFKIDDSSQRMEITRLQFATIGKNDPEIRKFLRDDGRILLVTKDHLEPFLPRYRSSSPKLSSMTGFSNESLILLKSSEDIIIATQIIGANTKSLEKPTLTRDVSRQHKPEPIHLDWMVNAENNPSSTAVAAVAAGLLQNEVQLLTLTKFPSYVQVRLGGLVLARSVKYLGHSSSNTTDSHTANELNTRLEWWKELRDEIKAHAKVLCCHYVIGYSETCTINGDICILNAIGTAAELKGLSQISTPITAIVPSPSFWDNNVVAATSGIHNSPSRKSSAVSRETSGTENSEPKTPPNLSFLPQQQFDDTVNVLNTSHTTPMNPKNMTSNAVANSTTNTNTASLGQLPSSSSRDGGLFDSSGYISAGSSELYPDSHARHHIIDHQIRRVMKKSRRRRACTATHVPYNHNTAPFAFMRLVPCGICKRKWVPETIFTTIDLPNGLAIRGKGRLLEARVVRPRKSATGEAEAVKVSEVLPFVEYDLQRQIILKLKVFGMNAVFGYNCQIEIGNDIVVATAICTAVYLNSLPAPTPLQIMRNSRELSSPLSSKVQQQEQEHRFMILQRQIEEMSSYYAKVLQQQYMESIGIGPGNTLGDYLHRKRSGSKALEIITAATSPAAGADHREDVGSVNSSRSTRSSSSSSSSSTDSSSSESINDGDDSSSLESPSSSSSSSSSSDSEESDEEEGGGGGGNNPLPGTENEALAETTEAVNFDSKTNLARARSHSTGSKRSDLLETVEPVDIRKKTRRKSARTSSQNPSSKDEMKGIAVMDPVSKFLKRKKEKRNIFKDDRIPYVLEIDDETDGDILSVLQDWMAPNGIEMINVAKMSSRTHHLVGAGQLVTVLRRGRLLDAKTGSAAIRNATYSSAGLNARLNRLFQEAYLKLCLTVKNFIPCQVLKITHYLNVLDDGQVEIVISAMVHKMTPKTFRSVQRRAVSFQESDCSDSLDTPWKSGALLTPPRSEVPPVEVNTRVLGGSPNLKEIKSNTSRSHSFDLSVSTASRARGASVSSNDSFVGEIATEASRTGEDEASTSSASNIPFHSLASKGSEKTGRLETIEETSVYGESNSQTIGREKSRNSFSGAPLPVRTRLEVGTPDAISTSGFPPSLKITPSYTDSQRLLSQRRTINLNHVILTPLADVPGARIKRYLGPVQLHFIKDFWAMRGEGTLGSFFYLLLSEVNAAARTHVAALGGNALLCHRLIPQEAGGKVARSQGYTMFSISGDAVILEFLSSSDPFPNEAAPSEAIVIE